MTNHEVCFDRRKRQRIISCEQKTNVKKDRRKGLVEKVIELGKSKIKLKIQECSR